MTTDMRCFAFAIVACLVLPGPARPQAATAAAPAATEQPPATPAPAPLDRPAPTTVQDGTPSSPKLSEKEQRKRDRDAERAAREKEKDASYLKLQGDEIVAPTLDADGKPIELAPCARKDKECQKKRKALLHRKKVGLRIENGTLTVDGWTSKARLNYDISEVKFLYVSIPGRGTVIASMEQFPNSSPQKNALVGKTLTLQTTGDHTVQISSDEMLVDKKEHVIYVAMDQTFTEPGRFPTLGYGSTAKAPYNWPGVRPLRESEVKISAKAPPLPTEMAIGQMKLPCQKVAPGGRPKPVKINGVTMTPEACPVTATSSALKVPLAPVPNSSGAGTDAVKP